MKMELLNPSGHTCLLPVSSSSAIAVSLSASRSQLTCFAKPWSEYVLKLGHTHTHQTSPLIRQRRRNACCLASTASAVAVKGDEGNSQTGVQVTETIEPNSRVRLTVKVPETICKESYEQVLAELGKKARVPGFRPGKIPRHVLINCVGKEKVQTAAIEAVLNRTLPEAMSSVAGRALKDSEHILTKFNELHAAFSPTSSLSYDVAVDIAPEVKWTSDRAYKNLKVIIEVESDADIERAAEAELKSRYKDLGSLRIVEDRGIQVGDVVILDVSAVRIEEDGSDGDKLSLAEKKGFHLDTEESTHLIPGFVDALLGLKRGQTRCFDLAFPNAWKQEELRGVLARFIVECKELFYRVLPELDDTIADKLLEGCNSLSQVRGSILNKRREMAEASKKQAIQQAVLRELPKVVEMDIPHSLLEEQGRQLYGARLIQLQTTMKLSEDQILTLSSEKAVTNYLLTQNNYDPETNWYMVMYEDGDSEELEWCDLQEIMLPLDIRSPLTKWLLKVTKVKREKHKKKTKEKKGEDRVFKPKRNTMKRKKKAESYCTAQKLCPGCK